MCATVGFMWKPAERLQMTNEQRATLEAWVRAKTSPQRTVLRARICLLAAEGLPNRVIAHTLMTSRPTVVHWRQRFEARGPDGLAEDATHWSTRTVAKAMGVSNATVSRIWDAHGLQPHRVEGFKRSTDKRFVEKLTDVGGGYLNPPDKAVVLCVDEKSQVPALARTQ